MSGDWRDDAACRDVEPELFFPGRHDDPHAAKKICATCPSLIPCLDLAMSDPEIKGIWGGTNLAERKAIRRDRGKRPRETGGARNVAMSMVARGIGYAEIAQRIGVTPRTIGRWKDNA